MTKPAGALAVSHRTQSVGACEIMRKSREILRGPLARKGRPPKHPIQKSGIFASGIGYSRSPRNFP
jgi:hypothetical protein